MRGGLRFAERSEVRDVMAYVRLAVNPTLDLSFYRIASRPARGLGPNAVKAIVARAVNGHPLYQVLSEMAQDGSWRMDAREGAGDLSRHLRALVSMKERARPPHEFISYIMGNIGYTDWATKREDAPKTLMASMQTLLDMSKDYDDIVDFARESVLDPDAEEDMSDAVTLTTIHASKGLEWKNVFVIALEAGLLPSKRATDDVGDPENPWDHRASGGIEEERRLFHVAMTRAADRLFISRSHSRLNQERVRPSSFLHEAGFEVSTHPIATVASATYQSGHGGRKIGSKKARYF
jgi:DNA helicase-2/ATP-dependent DNA helicase PcrA